MSPARAGAILLAAGRSLRMSGAGLPGDETPGDKTSADKTSVDKTSIDKTMLELAGLPVVAHALRAFVAADGIETVVLVCGESNRAALESVAEEHGGGKVAAIVRGGARRQDSVAIGLAALPEVELVAVHDAARPLVTRAMIERGLALAAEHGAAAAAARVTDTIKSVEHDDSGLDERDGAVFAAGTIDRSTLRAVQTPQTFRRDVLMRAHAEARAHADTRRKATDDTMLVEAIGQRVVLYDAGGPNLKITTPDDVLVATALLAAHHPEVRPAEARRRKAQAAERRAGS